MPDKQDDIATINEALPVLEDMARSEHPRDTTLAKVLLALIHLQPMNFTITAGPLEEPQKPFVVLSQQTGCEGM
jgi:hypothetical protein